LRVEQRAYRVLDVFKVLVDYYCIAKIDLRDLRISHCGKLKKKKE
jgi:hypothetical protein